MKPFLFLDIENHLDITKQLEKLFLNDVYLNKTLNGDNIFTFHPLEHNQPRYDILNHTTLWNYAYHQEVFERCPDIKEALDKLGVEVTGCSVLVVTQDRSGTRLGLHSDASTSDITYRLNWPVYQCMSGTTTSMYKLKPGTINLLATGQSDYKPPSQDVVAKSETGIYRITDIESEVASFVMDRPLLFKYNVPHRVYDTEPNVPYPRILISFDFKDGEIMNLVRED